ncbi:MAG: ABC transporter permease [Candidatus Latescibacterota bacterium]|nr:MAG: ABC transporter permease [Candidatus Latescibacterota bacterium]
MMKDTSALVVYAAAVIAITLVHHTGLLAAALAVAVVIAGQRAARLARKAFFAIVVFNLVVTVSYVVVSLVRDELSLHFVLLMNLRVFLLTFLGFLVADRINLFKAVSFSKTLSYLLTVAASQIVTFRRLFDDFRMAFKSRTPNPARSKDLYRHGASAASFFLHKSFLESAEITDAMKSRGFFDD